MKSPYSQADKQLAKLKKSISAEFHNTANLLNFDELNVADTKQTTKVLYDRLKSQSKQILERIAKSAYHDAYAETQSKGEREDEDKEKDFSGIALIAALFKMYHPLTRYVYKSEAHRKQERLMEGILSATGQQGIRQALDRAARLWFEQNRQYADFAVDEARLKAFKDAGVKKVQWRAEVDNNTCDECKKLNGEIFTISNVPDIPRHHHCRCYLTPVLDS